MTDEVITRIEGALARISLNRPQALHALNEPMCAMMIEALQAWKNDPVVKAVLIDHAQGTRGFCAGGDIRFLMESGQGDGAGARAFFHTEYRLNHVLQAYEKPVIAIVDGVVMGGGVGITAPALFRIATEKTTFAMPETGIGLFPDVGGGWFLPRLPDKIGMWLALTGARIKAPDCIAAGLSTHFTPSEKIPALVERLKAAATMDALRAAIEAAHESPGAVKELTEENRAKIAALFAKDSVEAIVAALNADGSAWAKAQAETLASKSPQTMKVAFRQLRTGAALTSFAENMKMEYRIAARVIHMNDFQDGVRAVIIDKDNAPRWKPETLEGVTDAFLDSIFAPLPADQEWTPLP